MYFHQMNHSGQNIVQQLAVKLSLADKSSEEIEELLNRHPSFGFARLLYSRKLTQANSNDAKKQLKKTALYFSNPHWLNYLLQNEEVLETLEEKEDGIIPVDKDDLPLDEVETTDTNSTPPPDRMTKLMERHLSDFKKPVEPDAELIAKPNPLFTIDYFASQGIKLTAQQGKDLLSGRVKSFTEWLKQMKKVNPEPVDLGTDAETERMIETIAQTSNEIKDVVTEAMAEVLIKQGKTEKAIQLYQKLSFLDTSKSTYFAAKIKELKDN